MNESECNLRLNLGSPAAQSSYEPEKPRSRWSLGYNRIRRCSINMSRLSSFAIQMQALIYTIFGRTFVCTYSPRPQYYVLPECHRNRPAHGIISTSQASHRPLRGHGKACVAYHNGSLSSSCSDLLPLSQTWQSGFGFDRDRQVFRTVAQKS